MSGRFVVVTGASGKTGAAVVAELVSIGHPVRAVVRRQDGRAKRLADLGAEVVEADLFEPMQVRAVLAGAKSVYFVPPWHPHALQAGVVVATEAHRAGLEGLVLLSQWLANPEHPSLLTRHSWLLEQVFSLLPDAAHVVINPGFFADNYLGNGLMGLAAQLGVLPAPLGQSLNAPPASEDIAAVVAACLADPGEHHGARYRPTGPALVTPAEIASEVGLALGRNVRFVDISLPMFLRALRVMGPRNGIDDAQLANVRWYYEESRLGAWEYQAPTDHVLKVTGRPAEPLANTVRRYTARPEAQRTPARLIAAIVDMARVGVTPAPRLDTGVRRRREPVPARPTLSASSAQWRSDHRFGPPVPIADVGTPGTPKSRTI